MGASWLACLAAIAVILMAAGIALSTHSEAVVLAEHLGVMLDTRRRCSLRKRTFLAQERLRSVFIHEVREVRSQVSSCRCSACCIRRLRRCLQSVGLPG